MRLYTNKKGQWVGTQAEAKREFGEVYQVEVPTDKAALLEYLNDRRVIHGNSPENVFSEAPTAHPVHKEPLPASMKPHAWQTIRECAERASIKDLSVALAVYMNRVDELADNVGQ